MIDYIVTQEANEYSVGLNNSSKAVDIANFGEAKRVTMILSATLGSGATVTATLKGSDVANGIYSNIAGGSITLTASGNDSVDVDIPNGVNFLKVALYVATAASKACVMLKFSKIT